MKSAYWPMIQIMAALASELSRAFKFSQRSLMMASYLFGYFLNMSLSTMIAS